MNAVPPAAAARPAYLTIAAVLIAVIAVSVLATLWFARTWLYPRPFEPVSLDVRERGALDAKIARLLGNAETPPVIARPVPAPSVLPESAPSAGGKTTAPAPDPYRERTDDRVLRFTQRELNAMIARNPDLANRLALHLGDEMLSATMLITLPPDLPVFAGQTVRVATGLRLGHDRGRAAVAIEGISIMGVPLPNAWIGGIKGQDLIALDTSPDGFWRAFADGIQDLRVENGALRVELAP